jgi:hypothetical protein
MDLNLKELDTRYIVLANANPAVPKVGGVFQDGL